MAKGEFILLLDHDDVISPDLLISLVSIVRKNPDVDFVYFDEDKLSFKTWEKEKPMVQTQYNFS